MTNKEFALSYLQKSLSVIPLWSRAQILKKPPSYFVNELNRKLDENKKSDNPISEDDVYEKYVTHVCKRPMILWTEFQTRHPTVDEVTIWFSKWPDANIGIVTGKISNLVVFDLDSEHANQYAEDEGGFPTTAKKIADWLNGKGTTARTQKKWFYNLVLNKMVFPDSVRQSQQTSTRDSLNYTLANFVDYCKNCNFDDESWITQQKELLDETIVCQSIEYLNKVGMMLGIEWSTEQTSE